MTHKGQVITLFKHFEAFVARQFNANVKQLQCDEGDELHTLETLLFQEGYNKRISCTYTPP